MVMLNCNCRQAFTLGSFECISCRQVIWVHIVCDRNRLYTEQPLEMLNALLKGFQRLIIFHVPNMVAEKGISSVRDAEGVFEFGANRENLGNFKRQFDGEGGVATRTADGINRRWTIDSGRWCRVK